MERAGPLVEPRLSANESPRRARPSSRATRPGYLSGIGTAPLAMLHPLRRAHDRVGRRADGNIMQRLLYGRNYSKYGKSERRKTVRLCEERET
jgi:hypothetical protein